MSLSTPVEIFFSDLDFHRRLLSDKTIQKKYRAAIRQAVNPGDVVLDLGTGSGIHAIFACQAGAKRVYAVERATIIELARGIARENGYEDKIVFLYGDSSQIRLPEKVDTIVTYMGFTRVLRSMVEAKKRFLKKDGRLIPSAIEFSLVPVQSLSLHRHRIGFWSKEHYGLRFHSFRSKVVHQPQLVNLREKHFLAKPETVSTVYLKKPVPENFDWTIEFKIQKTATLHGIGVWYSYQLSDKIVVSPRDSSLWDESYFSPDYFFPLESSLRVHKGSRVKVEFGLQVPLEKPVFGEALWKWEVEYEGLRSSQSNFSSTCVSNSLFRKLI